MKHNLSSRLRRAMPVAALVASGTLIAAIPSTVNAQAQGSSAHPQAASQDPQLAKQIKELRAQVARLQAALDQQRQPAPRPSTPAPAQQPPPGMGGMGKMGEDNMEDDKMGQMPPDGMDGGEMGPMPAGGMGMMGMDMGEMGMPPEGMKMPAEMMRGEMGMPARPGMPSGGTPGAAAAGSMPASGGMKMDCKAPRSMSALPGVPGTSHMYHIGSTGFFLDQPGIKLTGDQRGALTKIKERALRERGNAERSTGQAEQQLWALTGAGQPDATRVEAKAREIERLRTNQRLAFIQSVGQATKILTSQQRGQLLGTGKTPSK